jgi:hypothetical protein
LAFPFPLTCPLVGAFENHEHLPNSKDCPWHRSSEAYLTLFVSGLVSWPAF